MKITLRHRTARQSSPRSPGLRPAGGATAAHERDRTPRRGFTLVELMLAIATLGTIMGVAIPAYNDYREKAKVARTMSEIRMLEKEIKIYELDNAMLPSSLSDVGHGSLLDAWGSPYVYLTIADAKNKGVLRKDRFLVPLNSDYDLYSKGRDGKSQAPLTAKDSWDDIVRANDGGYVGLASEY